MSRVSNELLLAVLRRLELFAKYLAKDAIEKKMKRWLARLPWAALAVSVAVWLLEPQAIEKWCEKSAFRKDKTGKGFKNEADELIELEMAFNKMVES